jgi:pimeloyl-ACP methyl ester carboxylesterase
VALSELVYDRAGSGTPVVLLHGVGHRRQAWQPLFEQLVERYDVIAVDLAGFGDSPSYPKGVPYDMDNACADLSANFAQWGCPRPHVVGNSLGGAIGLELGARDLAASVTALSPAGFFGPVDRYRALGLLGLLRSTTQLPDPALRAATGHPRARRAIGTLLYAHPGRMDASTSYADAIALKGAPAFWPTIRSGLRYRFADGVSVPTTIAWGTEDRLLPYRQAGRAARHLPHATHVPLPGSGHVPMRDDPDRITRLVVDTVERARQRNAA